MAAGYKLEGRARVLKLPKYSWRFVLIVSILLYNMNAIFGAVVSSEHW